jgi:hypothetical protein
LRQSKASPTFTGVFIVVVIVSLQNVSTQPVFIGGQLQPPVCHPSRDVVVDLVI